VEHFKTKVWDYLWTNNLVSLSVGQSTWLPILTLKQKRHKHLL